LFIHILTKNCLSLPWSQKDFPVDIKREGKNRMNWDRTETIGLAKESCVNCKGLGLLADQGAPNTPCGCVLRAVFRACYARYVFCVTKEKYMSKVCLVARQGKERKRCYERLLEDYIADFYLVSLRSLNAFERGLFRAHFLEGGDWRVCCRRLRVDRGIFYHAVYHIQQKLGRVFRELRPYSLFPLDEYFAGRIQRPRRLPPVLEMPFPGRSVSLQPPLRKAA